MKIKELIFLPLFLLAACTHEMEVPVEATGVPVELRLAPIDTRGGEAGDPRDAAIREFRLIVFRGDGSVAYNQFTENLATPGENPVSLNMMTGTYDFVFIANEGMGTAADDMHTILANYYGARTLATLFDEAFPSDMFGTSINIPMTHIERNVQVKPGGVVKLTGNTNDTPANSWTVELVRLGIRLDLTLKASHGLAQHFEAIELANIPDKTYLFPTKADGTTRTYEGAYEPTSTRRILKVNLNSSMMSPPAGTWIRERIILPASVFADKADASKAVTLLAKMDDRPDLTGTIGLAEPADYTAPRNNWFKLNGTLQDYLDFTVSVEPWDQGNNNYYFDLPNPLTDEQQANTFLVAPGSKPFSIPVAWADDPDILAALGVPARIGAADTPNNKLEAVLLWTDDPDGLSMDAPLMDVDVHDRGEGAYVVVTPGQEAGNAVIALRDYETGEIFWSWHLWVTDYAPNASAATADGANDVPGGDIYRYNNGTITTVFMDRNLGALNATPGDVRAHGYLYQWGRKDPMRRIKNNGSAELVDLYDADGALIAPRTIGFVTNVGDAVKNPDAFISGIWANGMHAGWLETHNDALWNTSTNEKTVYDPCPAG